MAGRGWLMTVAALVGLGLPGTLQAQAATPEEESMAALVALHVELNAARDDLNNAIAAIHELQAQEEARQEFNSNVADILARHNRTRDEYQEMLYAVSTDNAKRELFDRLVREAVMAATTL